MSSLKIQLIFLFEIYKLKKNPQNFTLSCMKQRKKLNNLMFKRKVWLKQETFFPYFYYNEINSKVSLFGF